MIKFYSLSTLKICLAIIAASLFIMNGQRNKSHTVITVNGAVNADALGMTLSHEHIFSNFGLPLSETDTYDKQELFEQVIPYLRDLREGGVQTIVDYTANAFGRRADLLQAIADSTGINLITNTGIYGAAEDRYVPKYAYELPADELAKRWINEFKEGIDGTGIRPGFIKLAFDEGPPSGIDQKLFEAGLKTHVATGLTIAVHTGSNPEAVKLQLELLKKYGVDPSAWIWTHANWHDDFDRILKVAERGAWISMDGVNTDNIETYIEYIKKFKEEGLLDRLLLSHDGDAYPAGGGIRPFDAIPTELIPALRSHDFSDAVINRLFVENPGQAYAVRVRQLKSKE